MNILQEIAEFAKIRVAGYKAVLSAAEVKDWSSSLPRGNFAFETALKKPWLSFICECKKASPSKGLIAENFPHVDIAKAYESAGADAISVLTEPKYFLGDDEYMIHQAKILGADAVLLICAILDDVQLKSFIATCDELGLSALVEAHDETEIRRALNCGARVIGVNNRNLKNFSVDMDNAAKLRELVPPEKIFVSESGVQTPDDVKKIRALGADAVLIGEVLMRAVDKKSKLDELRGDGS